ncbi:MAG: hypothetical protein Q9214_003409, partial [Letrouitia sp. 1 TL-2023]
MTRNNLQKHLLWLCKGQSTVPSPSTVTPSSENSFTTFGTDASRSSHSQSQTFDSACINEEIETVGDGPRLQQRGEQFAVPLLPASVLNNSDPEAMARLQSGSKSGKRPRLLSQAAQDDLQTPMARTRSSLQDHYNAGCSRGGS